MIHTAGTGRRYFLSLTAVGCTNSPNPPQEVGRDGGGQTQGTSYPGSAGAGSQATTGAVCGGHANNAPGSMGSNGGH